MLRTRGTSRCAMMLCLLVTAPAGAQQRDTVPGTRMVVVDGHEMRVLVQGLAERRPGAPVVVFEAGARTSLDVWAKVLPAVARSAPVVAYDRSGIGQSPWDGQSPTPAHVVARLRRLLSQVGAGPPYLLVGWSWGGSLARYFAGYHPTEVAGIVYVDPGPLITQSMADELVPYEQIGAGRAGYDAFWNAFEGINRQAPPGVRAEFDVFRGLMQREPADRDLRPAPPVPVVMLIAAKPTPLPLQLPFDAAAHFEADVRHRIRMLQEWALAAPRGTVVVSNHTTHAIPRDEPELIVWAVQRVLDDIARAHR